MKLFGLFKEKPLTFEQFREQARLAVRRAKPGVRAENNATGLNLVIDGKQMTANLKQQYQTYLKNPRDRDEVIAHWLDNLVTEAPDQSWSQAKVTLRPLLKNDHFVQAAMLEMRKGKVPDTLPHVKFAGDLSVIGVREIGRSVFAVTGNQLANWGVTIEEVMHEAVNNFNLLSFPPVTNEMTIGGSSRRNGPTGEVVGLMFEGDHLAATWVTVERFRDHVGLRLQGDYVVSVPNRNRLVAVRVDEPGLISSMVQANKNYLKMPYSLTSQCYSVSAAQTGGVVEVYNAGLGASTSALDPHSVFASSSQSGSLPNMVDAARAPEFSRPGPVDLSTWGGLSEPTEDTPAPTPWNRGKS